ALVRSGEGPERRARTADRGRRGPGPGGPAGDPGPRGPGLPGDLRGAVAEARGRSDDDVRPRSRRDGAGEGHRGPEPLRAPPGAARRGRTRLVTPLIRRTVSCAATARPVA